MVLEGTGTAVSGWQAPPQQSGGLDSRPRPLWEEVGHSNPGPQPPSTGSCLDPFLPCPRLPSRRQVHDARPRPLPSLPGRPLQFSYLRVFQLSFSMWFSGPSLSKEAMKRAERRRAAQTPVRMQSAHPVPSPALMAGTARLRRDSGTQGQWPLAELVHRSLLWEVPGPSRPRAPSYLLRGPAWCWVLSAGPNPPGSQVASETGLLCPYPSSVLCPPPPHKLTCGLASSVWCGDSDQPPMETNKGELRPGAVGAAARRGGLTFLAVDGRRKQVVLNLLVLFKGTLHPRPGHELVDLSGDLPKFLQGQRTAASPSPRSGPVLLPAQCQHRRRGLRTADCGPRARCAASEPAGVPEHAPSCPPPGPSGWRQGLRLPGSGTPTGPHP